MEELNPSVGEYLDPIKIYLDDLTEIYKILEQVSAKIEIKTKKTRYDSIKELIQNEPQNIYNLRLSCENPEISIDFKNNEIWIYIAKDTLISRGAYEKIKSLLISRRIKFWKVIASKTLLGGIGFISIFSFTYFIIDNIINKKLSSLIVFPILGILSLIALLKYTKYVDLKIHANIYLIPRENSNFFIRKKDDLLVSLFTGVIGIIVGYIIAKIS